MILPYASTAPTNVSFDPAVLRRAGVRKSESRNILVVDDDPIVRDIYQIALNRFGYAVAVAKDGPSGLVMAAATAPDLIFLDIRMPRMDGIEVLEQLATNAATIAIPVVMLSNYDDDSFVRRCLDLGAKEYLVKANINPEDLATVATRWIRQSG